MNRKTCTRCQQSLPADEKHFGFRSYSAFKLRCWCKPCAAEQKLERKAAIADGRAAPAPAKVAAPPPLLPTQSTAGLDLARVWSAS